MKSLAHCDAVGKVLVKKVDIRNFAYKVSIEMLIESGWSLIGRA